MEAVDIVNAVVNFMYNENKNTIFDMVYGEGHHDRYKMEKMVAMDRFLSWWGSLDNDNKQKLVNLAIQRSR